MATTTLANGGPVTISMVQTVLALLISLGACTAGGYTIKVNRPSFGTGDAVPGAVPTQTPPYAPARATDPAKLATPRAEPIEPDVARTASPAPTSDTRAPQGGASASDGGTAYVDPQGRFELWFGDSWSRVDADGRSDAASGDDAVSSDEVSWLLRLQRGEPGAPIPPGAAVPPNGAEITIGVAGVEPGADLAAWALEHMPVDTDRWSITADAMRGTVGAEAYAGVFREGQILPYYGRWREWLVPDPRSPGQVYVVRLTAYGREDNWEMAQGKVVARTLQLR